MRSASIDDAQNQLISTVAVQTLGSVVSLQGAVSSLLFLVKSMVDERSDAEQLLPALGVAEDRLKESIDLLRTAFDEAKVPL